MGTIFGIYRRLSDSGPSGRNPGNVQDVLQVSISLSISIPLYVYICSVFICLLCPYAIAATCSMCCRCPYLYRMCCRCPSVPISALYLNLPVCPSLCIYVSICLSIYLSVCLSVCLSIYLSMYLSISIFLYIWYIYMRNLSNVYVRICGVCTHMWCMYTYVGYFRSTVYEFVCRM